VRLTIPGHIIEYENSIPVVPVLRKNFNQTSNMIKQQASTPGRVPQIRLFYKGKIKPSELPKITNSLDAYQVFMANWDLGRIELQEQFKVLLLNRNNRVLGYHTVSTGGTAGTVVDVKLLFAVALKAKASSLIVAHNHPSGNLKASEEDLALTKKLTSAGKFLEMPVLDHLIVTREGYYSFANDGEI